MKSILRFSLRDLLWLAIVVALFVLWWTDHRELVRMRNEAKEYWPAPFVAAE